MDEELVPFTDVVSLAAEYDFGTDQWESWRRVDLVQRTRRVSGTNQYGISAQELRRFKFLLAIYGELIGRKSPDKVAYYAALSGVTDLPAILVADHIEKSLMSAYAYMRRSIVRSTSSRLDPHRLDPPTVRPLAKKMTRSFLTGFPIRNPMKRAMVEQFLVELLVVMISLAYKVHDARDLDSPIRLIAKAVFRLNALPAGLKTLKQVLSQDSSLLIDPLLGQNKLISHIHTTARDSPAILLRSVRDSALFLRTLQRTFPSPQTTPKRAKDLVGKEISEARVLFMTIPMVSALFLEINLDNPKSKFLADLRSADGQSTTRALLTMDRLAERARVKWES